MRDVFPNALHVARREYLFRVRGRTFIITTALLAIAVAAVTMLPTFLAAIGAGDPPEIAVAVRADDLATDPVVAIQAVLLVAEADPQGGVPAPSGRPDAGALEGAGGESAARVTRVDDADAAAARVREGELDGLLTITRDGEGELAFDYLTDASPTNQTRILVTQAANALAISERLERAGISAVESADLFAPADVAVTPADPDASRDDEDVGGSLLLTYVVVVLTFMAILTYGTWVAQSVAEEKSGRVMELLITAATPRQLLTGKVLGTGAAGLTQYAAMIAAVAIGFAVNGPISAALGVSGELAFRMPQLEPAWIAAFTVFFLLGFLLYSTLYAAAGSMVSRVEDVQQAIGPLMYLAMGGYFASTVAINDPSASWVQGLSIVPFFSPYLMPARMLLADPTPLEVLTAIALLMVAVALAVWFASRVYSAGVLLYGQRPGLRTVLRAARVAR